MRKARLANRFSLLFNCSKSAATVSVAVWKRRRSSGSTYIFHSAHMSVCFPVVGGLKRRCSAAGTPPGSALAGICLSNSARNGSNSESSIWSLRRRISISARFLESGEQEITVQLLHIKLGPFTHAAPQNGSPVVMHFQHVSLCFLARIAEDPLENHGHIAHQIYGIVVDHHLPGNVKIFFGTRFFFDGGLHRRNSSHQLVRGMSCSFHSFDLQQAHAGLPWPATHAENANIPRPQFKPVAPEIFRG